MKKYELTEETRRVLGKTVHRIRYLIDIPKYGVKAGDLGGWLESERNLSQEGNCCVLDGGYVTGNGCVSGDGCVRDDGCVTDNGSVRGNGSVSGHGCVRGNGYVSGDGCVRCHGCVSGDGCVSDNGCVSGHGCVRGNGCVSGNGCVTSNWDIATISGFGSENRTTTFYLTKDGDIGVTCGCFVGTLDEFREQAKETHGDTDIAQEYLEIANLMERRFKRTSLWKIRGK